MTTDEFVIISENKIVSTQCLNSVNKGKREISDDFQVISFGSRFDNEVIYCEWRTSVQN